MPDQIPPLFPDVEDLPPIAPQPTPTPGLFPAYSPTPAPGEEATEDGLAAAEPDPTEESEDEGGTPSATDALYPGEEEEREPILAESERIRRWPPPSIEISAAERIPVRRTALHQARGTGDSILQYLTGVRGTFSSPLLPAAVPPAPGIRVGPINLRPAVTLGLTTSDRSSPRGDTTDVSGYFQGRLTAFTIRPGRVQGSLLYAIGLTSGTGRRSGLDVEQHLSLSTSFSIERIARMHFGAAIDFTDLSGIDRDVGGSARRTLITGSLTTTYRYSRKTSFDWDVTVPLRTYGDGLSSTGVTNTFSVNNRISRKTSVGLGVTVGVLDVEGSETQTFEQPLLTFKWRPTRLVSIDATGGVEFRQTGAGSSNSPTFGVSASWRPRLGTAVSLAAEERVVNSASSANTNFNTTSVVVSVNQRFSHLLNGSVSLAYENASYESTGLGGISGRDDDLLSASSVLTLQLTRHWNSTLTLSASDNSSNVSPFRVYQATLQTSFAF